MNKEKINVAIICHDHCLSGANKSLLDWITTANKDKYKIICIIPRKNKQFEERCKKNNIELVVGNYFVTVKHLYNLSIKENIKNIIKNLLRIYINPISFLILKSKLKKKKVKLIHSNSFAVTFGIKMAIKMKIPHVWHIREFMEEDHQIKHFESEKKIKEYCKYSNAIFISDIVKTKYDKCFDNENKNVIYNKIEYDEKYNKERKFGENNQFNILMAGTLSNNKGQMDAIMAIQELKKQKYQNIKLYICGIGDNERNLKNYVKNNSLEDIIQFKGQVSNLTEFRKIIDIALVCSKSEALGRVTIEAMYYRNLVVGANAGCTPYILTDNQTGILYESGSHKELADKIKNIINNKDDCIRIIEKAQKEAIDKFYNINYSNEIFKIYEKILTDNGGENNE